MSFKSRFDYLFELIETSHEGQLQSMGFSVVHYMANECLHIIHHVEERLKWEITIDEVQGGALATLPTAEDYASVTQAQAAHAEHVHAVEHGLESTDKDIKQLKQEAQQQFENNPETIEPLLSASICEDLLELGAEAHTSHLKHLKEVRQAAEEEFGMENILMGQEAQDVMIGACRMFRIAHDLRATSHCLASKAWGQTEMALAGFNTKYYFNMIEGVWGEQSEDEAPASEMSAPPTKKACTVTSMAASSKPIGPPSCHLIQPGETPSQAGIAPSLRPVYELRDYKDKRYFCQVCGDCNANHDTILTHVHREHLNQVLGCPYSDYSSPSYATLKKYQETKHPGLSLQMPPIPVDVHPTLEVAIVGIHPTPQ